MAAKRNISPSTAVEQASPTSKARGKSAPAQRGEGDRPAGRPSEHGGDATPEAKRARTESEAADSPEPERDELATGIAASCSPGTGLDAP
eukprot:12917450-Prorocentrum_lima.AAC.1